MYVCMKFVLQVFSTLRCIHVNKFLPSFTTPKNIGRIFQFNNIIILKIISFNNEISSMSFMKLDFVIHNMSFLGLDFT